MTVVHDVLSLPSTPLLGHLTRPTATTVQVSVFNP